MNEEDLITFKEIFDKYDENHNGVLDKEEFFKGFGELVKLLGEGHSEEEIRKITEEAIEKFDLNHNGKIEINEFNEIMIFLVNEKGLSMNDLL